MDLALELTKLALAFPRQRLSEAEHEERVVMYVESLAPRWAPEQLAEAMKRGRLRWQFFPTIAEIEVECHGVAPPADPSPRLLCMPKPTENERQNGLAVLAKIKGLLKGIKPSSTGQGTVRGDPEADPVGALQRVAKALAGRRLIPMPWRESGEQALCPACPETLCADCPLKVGGTI